MKRKEKFKLDADHQQIAFRDKDADPATVVGDNEFASLSEDRLACCSAEFIIQTGREGIVPIEVEVTESAPISNDGEWDHIAECSLRLSKGNLDLQSTTSSDGLKLKPGDYRARIFYGGLTTIDEAGLKGKDHYRVVFWPAKASKKEVIKRFVA